VAVRLKNEDKETNLPMTNPEYTELLLDYLRFLLDLEREFFKFDILTDSHLIDQDYDS
jgi:hypothetical protein